MSQNGFPTVARTRRPVGPVLRTGRTPLDGRASTPRARRAAARRPDRITGPLPSRLPITSRLNRRAARIAGHRLRQPRQAN